MKRSRFSEQQIAFILRQAEEGTTVEEVCPKAGINQLLQLEGQVWRADAVGDETAEATRGRERQAEDVRRVLQVKFG